MARRSASRACTRSMAPASTTRERTLHERVRRSTPDLAPERTLVAKSTKTSLIHEAEHRRRRHAFARGHTGHLSRQNAGETPRHKSLDSSFLNNIFSLVADKNRLHDFRDPLLAAGAREHRTACTTGSSSIHNRGGRVKSFKLLRRQRLGIQTADSSTDFKIYLAHQTPSNGNSSAREDKIGG